MSISFKGVQNLRGKKKGKIGEIKNTGTESSDVLNGKRGVPIEVLYNF